MRKLRGMAVALFVVFAFHCGYAAMEGDVVRLDVEFQEPEVRRSMSFPGYDHIEVRGTRSLGEVREPQMPVKGVNVLIPPDKEIDAIELDLGVSENRVTLPGRYRIEPAQKEYHISQIGKIEIIPDEPKPEIYESENIYPSAHYKLGSVQKKMGYRRVSK